MGEKKSPLFVSLYWKAASGLAVIFLALISVFTYLNAVQLNTLQTEHRARSQEQYLLEYHGLLKKAALQLINLIDTLPNLNADTDDIKENIQNHWLSLQITWGLESAVLVDKKGQIIQHWGDQRVAPRPDTIAKVLFSGLPAQEMICQETCQLAVSAPILAANGDLQLIQLSVSMADVMLDFQRITGADIGILILAAAAESDHSWLGDTGFAVSALTHREQLQPVLEQFVAEQRWQAPFFPTKEESVVTINTSAAQFEVLLLSNSDLARNKARVVFISNTTHAQEQIRLARRAYVVTGLLAAMVALTLIVLVLWRPIRSLQRQANALPLLPQGKFQEAKRRLQGMAKNRLFADEISRLQETSLTVTEQLEHYHKQLTQHTKKLFEMAHFDTLTGLINRVYLTELIDSKLVSKHLHENHFALIYLDLDNFKHINDVLGHNMGDRLLVIVAKRLLGCIGSKDLAARLGGDEFCLIVDQTHQQHQASVIAERVLKALLEPIAIEGRKLSVSTSIGIAFSSTDGDTAAALLQNADLAMYQAKVAGKNKYHVFDHQLHKDADSRMALDEELRRAVLQQEFVLHYQPQIDLQTGKLIGCEALIRWQHPERGLLAPFYFIDALESNGLIIPVGKWILQEACRQCGAWSRAGLDQIKMSVNLSTRQFSDPDLLQDIQSALAAAGITPAQLELEVTESLLAIDIKHAIAVLEALQRLGASIAIDDFGTGYSSLNYLKQLPLDKLKIDRTFVKDIPASNDDKQITAAIIAMAHSLNLQVVAEGVETREQMTFLQDLQCEYGQGYLFNKPLTPEQFFADPLAPGSFSPPRAQP